MPTQNIPVTVDTDLLIFTREQLIKTLVKASNRPRPRLKIASGEIVPIVQLTGYDWETQIDIVEFDSYGIATVLSGISNDGGKVGIFARKMSYPIRTISDFTEIPWFEIQTARAKNVNIDQRYADALTLGMDKKINAVGYLGDPDFGLQGLFTSQISRVNQSQTFASAIGSPDTMLSLLSNTVSLAVSNANSIWVPKIVVMPEYQHQILGNTMRSTGTTATVLSQFLENQKALGQVEEVIVDNSLKGLGEGGTDAMLVLPYDNPPMNTGEDDIMPGDDHDGLNHPIYFAIALEMQVPDEFMQWHDTMYKQRAIMRIGGLVVSDPTAGIIASGI